MDNIEEKFGGTASNVNLDIPNSLFPPRMPSCYFLKDDEDPNKILITEEEYTKLVENNKIREDCISPYIKEIMKNKKKQYNFELQLKYVNKTEWKFQNEFDRKNKFKKLTKFNYNFTNDLQSFNSAKHSFYKSINLLNGNK